MNRVAVIIPAYRAPDELERCLAAIRAQSFTAIEVFVRDNSEDNIFYTAAINEGLVKYCYRDDIESVLVLNQDAYLRPDAVAHLVNHMAKRPDCGIACPLQVAGPSNHVTWGGARQAFPYGVHRRDPFETYREPFETFWGNGAAMFIRSSVVREIGVFDKNMKFIGSDADFSFTARSRGWKVMVVPNAVAEHSFSSSAKQASVETAGMKTRDMIYFAEKWITGEAYRSLAFESRGMMPADGHNAIEAMRASLQQAGLPQGTSQH